MLITICIATYRRPDELRGLLRELDRLAFSRVTQPKVEVVVVDNEGAGAAAAACHQTTSTRRWPLRVFDEPRQGITYARNRGLEEARPDTDLIAFIDDDETPDPGWLEALLLARERHRADVATGPVHPLLPPQAPSWVERGGFFSPRQHPEGQELDVAFTNNVLMDASIPREMGRMFDHRFALSGGEDTDFFMSVRRAGYRIVWARDAIVHERIPEERTRVSWLLRRGYREWGSHSLSERELYPGARVRLERLLKATALVLGGVVSLPFTALLGRHRAVRSLLWTARGLGSFSGLMGRQYLEYERPSRPGSPGR